MFLLVEWFVDCATFVTARQSPRSFRSLVLTATRLEEFTGDEHATLRDGSVRRKWRYHQDSSVVEATRKNVCESPKWRNYTALM